MVTGPLVLVGIGLIVILIFMVITWIASRLIKNSGIVDVAWSFGFTLAALLYLALDHAGGTRAFTIAGMVILWSLRLTWYTAMRFKKTYPNEDPRYAALKEKMGEDADEKMLFIFLWQGVVLTLMTAPLAVAIDDQTTALGILQIVSMVIWLVALIGETVADAQLSHFTSNSANKGHTCQDGLWRYSRHPNYFFEWLGAVSFFLYAADSPYGLWTVICPLVMLHLLINITGIKPTEEHALASRSDYSTYQKRTSPFIPWFRRNVS